MSPIGSRRAVLSAGETYADKVLGMAPIAYWPLWEASGTTAYCLANTAQNGTHGGVTLGSKGIGDGNICPSWDGSNDYVDVYSTTYRDAFNGAEGSISMWAKVNAAGVWLDGDDRYFLQHYGGATDYIFIRKDSGNNAMTFYYYANSTDESYVHTISTVAWFHIGMRWSKTSDEVKYYIDGATVGTPDATLGTWGGTLTSTNTCIGANNNSGNTPFHGYLAHVAIFDSALSDGKFAGLATL